MAWQFRNDIPIYTQLIAQIQQRIVSGALLPGERLPSVRDLAAEAGVNPNTMQRALAELETQGLRESLARNQVKDFLEGMYQLGFQLGEIVTFVQTEGEKGHHEHSGV